MKKLLFSTIFALAATIQSNATVWRVNNNTGIDADFNSIASALGSASVVDGDTIHLEPSTTAYGSITLTKELVFIGNGYFLSGANSNSGLQANTNTSSVSIITLNAGSQGSRFLGLTISYFNLGNSAGLGDYVFENCLFEYGYIGTLPAQTYNDILIRKCAFTFYIAMNNTSTVMNNFTIENCIFYTPSGWNNVLNFSISSTNLVFRNNTLNNVYFSNISNFYVANNIFLTATQNTFNSCIIKNNIFRANQAGVTVGPLSTNGNNLVSQTVANVIVNSGSTDGQYQLAVSSPAIDGGVDIGGNKPDCGAFGGNDPYELSGIPSIPSIYSVSFPNGNSVPLNSPSILIDFSTRDNK